MGWHEAHCAAVVGNPAATWFGTEPPIVVVLQVHRLVAAVAIRGIERVVVVDMAGSTGRRRRRHVRSGERKSGHAVIERGRVPARCRVAGGAVRGRKGCARRRVHGIIRLLPCGQMALRIAAIGGGNRQTVVVVDVAEIAGHVGVPVGQGEAGRAVIEHACGPGGNRVACCARRCSGRKTRRDVIRH